MQRYAQINIVTGFVVSDSRLSGQVDKSNMIPIADDFDLKNKKYINGEILLNQAEILSNQNAADEVLAEILLNQVAAL